MKKPTYKQLEAIIKDYEASRPLSYRVAIDYVKKLTTDRYMGSSILFEVKPLGKESFTFNMLDGLSQNTIEALIADILRSYELSIMYGPNK